MRLSYLLVLVTQQFSYKFIMSHRFIRFHTFYIVHVQVEKLHQKIHILALLCYLEQVKV